MLSWVRGGRTSSGFPQNSTSSGLQGRKVNDSLYEIQKPQDNPNMQVLFFHGLPCGDFSTVHLSTWETEDDAPCIWPQTWLVDKYPRAHILFVTYVEHMRKGGSSDMHIIKENLTSDLIEAKIGQMPNCPVVLVGHCFGGLVIKQICMHAYDSLGGVKYSDQCKTFLNNVGGIFYYATPHRGSPYMSQAKGEMDKHMFKHFKVLSTEAARMNSRFNQLRQNVYTHWEIAGLGESLTVESGRFRGVVVVPEGSAREGEPFHVVRADHFSITKPKDKNSRRFSGLTELIDKVATKLREKIKMQEEEEVRARPGNFQRLPREITGIDFQLREIVDKLKKVRILGLVGMGGVGKTTLAMAVFNKLCPAFEYTCFVRDVKKISGDSNAVKKQVWKHIYWKGRKVGPEEDWSKLGGKQVLLVLDDILGDRDVEAIFDIVEDTSVQSQYILTSREQDRLQKLKPEEIHDVQFLNPSNALELFMSHAFPELVTPPPPTLTGLIETVVQKCEGLPLTLVVLGQYLKWTSNEEDWRQTTNALESAETVTNLEEKLWLQLRPSYNGLPPKEKQLFLDATTFFCKGNTNWTLREVKAAWKEAYQIGSENLLWKTLVDRYLVYKVEDNESIRVHEQLQSLGRKIATESNSDGPRRVWDTTEALRLLQSTDESDNQASNQEIFALRLDRNWQDREGIHIGRPALRKFRNVRYLELDAPVMIDKAPEDESFPSMPILLKCVGLQTFNPNIQGRLVVLRLSGENVMHLPTSIGNFKALRIFTLFDVPLASLPDELGRLSQLEHLELVNCPRLRSLPETFGALSGLNHLEIRWCEELRSLPQSFRILFRLKHLKFENCTQLKDLPEFFWESCALNNLEFCMCEIKALPRTFWLLASLVQLKFDSVPNLATLPHYFGGLKALKHLVFIKCINLHRLPESFGDLSALDHLEFRSCVSLQSLPESFGQLSSLRHLELIDCDKLNSLPQKFGQLSNLQYLKMTGEENLGKMEELPNFLENLVGLRHLIIDCTPVKSIPDYLKNLRSLDTLDLGNLPFVQQLPRWLEEIGVTPLHLSRKVCRISVKDGRVSLTREETGILSKDLMRVIHGRAMEKMRGADYEEALANLGGNLGRLEPQIEGFLLQERGILNRLAGDLHQALKDLTAALDYFSLATNGHHHAYDCWKHRGFVNFKLGDLEAARKDAKTALDLQRKYRGSVVSHSLGEKLVEYMDFRLEGRREFEERERVMQREHLQVMQRVRARNVPDALVIWNAFGARDLCNRHRGYYLQERGVLRQMADDLRGAMEDLTEALEIDQDNRDCWKHRGYTKFLLEDLNGARMDAERCHNIKHTAGRMKHKKGQLEHLGAAPVTFLEFNLE